jgi:tRNA 2-selenouridine synthase
LNVKHTGFATVAQASEFDEIIDTRSPAEYAIDHIPGAINLPVLDNEERAKVGTLHNQASAFEAKKLGASLVSRNIARHLEAHFIDKPKQYHPLIYCWRGGNRSGSLTHVLQKVGFPAAQLIGGYREYRRGVVQDLERLPAQFNFRVICGPTGSGKSRLLDALSRSGEQVLDLEALAAHRGSVLGVLPGQPQPTQKYFESLIWQQLHQMHADKPVFVESESKKIGSLHVPNELIAAMRASACIQLDLPREARIRLLIEDYAHFLEQPESLVNQLDFLAELRGKKTVDRWKHLIESRDWSGLVGALLEEHYDPAYRKSISRNYAAPHASTLSLNDITAADFELAAFHLISH